MSNGVVGYDHKARKITRGYIGVNNKARRIVKGYVGINGKAQLIDYGYNVEIPYLSGEYVYNRDSQSVSINNIDNRYVNISGTTSATDAGTYTVIFSLKSPFYKWNDDTRENKYVTWVIEPKHVSIPTVSGVYTYNETAQNVSFNEYDTNAVDIIGELSQTNAGTYPLTYSLTNINNYRWIDESTASKSGSWTINKLTIPVPHYKGSMAYVGCWIYYLFSDKTQWSSLFDNFKGTKYEKYLDDEIYGDDDYLAVAPGYHEKTFGFQIKTTYRSNVQFPDGSYYAWDPLTIEKATLKQTGSTSIYASRTVTLNGAYIISKMVQNQYSEYLKLSLTGVIYERGGLYCYKGDTDSTLEITSLTENVYANFWTDTQTKYGTGYMWTINTTSNTINSARVRIHFKNCSLHTELDFTVTINYTS